MDFKLSNSIQLNQKFILTPQIQQSIEVLLMGQQELNSFIEQQALENPVMEVNPNYDELEPDEKLKKKLEWLEENGSDSKVYYKGSDDEKYQYTMVDTGETSLAEYLIEQLDYLTLGDLEYRIVERIIHYLDYNGYIEGNLEDISGEMNVSVRKVEDALKVVQSFEPYGVGARNLKECLLIQIRNRGMEDKNLISLVINYLEDLGKNRLNSIAKGLNISLEEVKKLHIDIKNLNPHPGSTIGIAQQTRYIRPDVVVVKFKDYFEVMLNEFSYPRVGICDQYTSLIQGTCDVETKEYITNKINQACWIIRAIEQRNSTLRNVSRAIVDLQQDFFSRGAKHIVPMILSDIAQKLSIHESTVSRAIHDKYLQCSWGIFNLKYFFSGGVGGEPGQGQTQGGIKAMLKDIINSEDRRHPLSDQKIAEKLNQKGVNLARRTVAKYREELNIPVASGRKDF